MQEIAPRIFVGADADVASVDIPGWWILHAAKEPYHRQFVGYAGRGAPKDHPEYLFARRGNRMALNMVDAKSPDFFSREMIEAGLDFLAEGYRDGKNLLIHCNQGESRGPSMALLFVFKRLLRNGASYAEAEAEMRQVYPAYHPGEGIHAYLARHWDEYEAASVCSRALAQT